MSLYKGTSLLAGVATNTISNAHSLFDFMWSDHIKIEMSWLRADTFSWQSGAVYVAAYNHLVADYNGGTSQTETVGSYTITYVLADDGHKITTDETNVANIYNESGVAWYYVLDTTNQRFKLPRTKYGVVGLRDTVGKYVPESLPSIKSTNWGVTWGSGQMPSVYWEDPYSNDYPVQQRATQMYLYFYVGQFSQSATEQTAGLNSELFNGKLDLNAANLSTQGKSLISGLGMPSGTYEDLTLLASGQKYTAPANGWVDLSVQFSSSGWFWLGLWNNNEQGMGVTHLNTQAGGDAAFLPVKNGDIFRVDYTNLSATKFRFIYAEGEPNV